MRWARLNIFTVWVVVSRKLTNPSNETAPSTPRVQRSPVWSEMEGNPHFEPISRVKTRLTKKLRLPDKIKRTDPGNENQLESSRRHEPESTLSRLLESCRDGVRGEGARHVSTRLWRDT